MAWMIDPRLWDDPWYRSLPSDAREIWKVCLFGVFRTNLPGLCKNVSVLTLSEAVAFTPEQTRAALDRALAPDTEGKVHLYLDPAVRVARVPQAPMYNRADNPNVLVSWYRQWRDVPDCVLKFEHVASLKLGVNLAYTDKQGRHTMAAKWSETFEAVEREYQVTGVKLRSYVDLAERRSRPAPVQAALKGFDTPPKGLPSGSGIWDQDQDRDRDLGSGITRFPNRIETPPPTLSDSEQTPDANGAKSASSLGTAASGGTVVPIRSDLPPGWE